MDLVSLHRSDHKESAQTLDLLSKKTLFERRAQQSEATRNRNLDKVKSILLNQSKSQRMSEAKSKDVEPPTLEPLQTLVIPNYYDESSSHTPMDMDESSQSSFVIRLPPRQTAQKENPNKEIKTRRASLQNTRDVEAKDVSRKVDGATSEGTKASSRKSASQSSRRSSANIDALEERLLKKLEDKIEDSHALEAAHREFYESKIEDLVYQRTQTLKNNLYQEMDELQWALLRSEETKRTLEANQIRMIAVIDEMQSQLQELRYELGYGASDETLESGRKRGALCAELYPDHYATLNPPQRPTWTRKASRNRARFEIWSKDPADGCHRPAQLNTECKYKADGRKDHLPMMSGKDQHEQPTSPSPQAGPSKSTEPLNRKRPREDETPRSEATRCSEWSEHSSNVHTGGHGAKRSVKRPRQSVESLCNDDRHDLAMKQ